jgi:putative FmdB family regulatory protein
MPTYDYVCQNCDHQFEEFQSITAKSLRKCPKCNRLKLKRLIGIGAGVIFKGSGFYETDYRSESYKKSAKADKSEAKGDTGDKADTGSKDKQSKETPAKDTSTAASAKQADESK